MNIFEPVVAYLLSIVVMRPENDPDAIVKLLPVASLLVTLVDNELESVL